MEDIRQWLLGVAACAMLVSMLRQLCPTGGVRRIARLTGGLLLLYAMLRPLADVRLPDAAWDAGAYREAVARLELELGEKSQNTLRDGIAEELEAYIEDKAALLGANVRAEISMSARGAPTAPAGVTLRGGYNAALSDWLTEELGIAKEKQEWIGDG